MLVCVRASLISCVLCCLCSLFLVSFLWYLDLSVCPAIALTKVFMDSLITPPRRIVWPILDISVSMSLLLSVYPSDEADFINLELKNNPNSNLFSPPSGRFSVVHRIPNHGEGRVSLLFTTLLPYLCSVAGVCLLATFFYSGDQIRLNSS